MNGVKKKLRSNTETLIIRAEAECEGPEGIYTTFVEGDGDTLTFRQDFSYRDEVRELYISGNEGIDGRGEPINEFMVFYGRMHDYVRIALQPDYLLHEIDSLVSQSEKLIVFGKTGLGYVVEYQTDREYLPVSYTFYLEENHSIRTFFESWAETDNGMKVPEHIRIEDGEKVFTFRYKDIIIN
jgi:hypothetical protein